MTQPNKNPLERYAGILITAGAFIVTGWLMLKPGMDPGHHPDMDRDYTPLVPEDITEFEPMRGTMQAGLDMTVALGGDPELAEWANAEFGTICAACHGTTGRGDGPAGKALGARDFSKADAWKNGHGPLGIYKSLTEGVAPSMPGYDTYSPAQRFALAKVVTDWGTFQHNQPTPAEIASFDTKHSLSAGVMEPNRVAVSVAMQALSEEESTTPCFNSGLLSNTQAALLTDCVEHMDRAMTTLAGLDGWNDDSELFSNAMLAGMPANGFRAHLSQLDGDAWSTLHQIFVAQF
jgi:hypothetical protein